MAALKDMLTDPKQPPARPQYVHHSETSYSNLLLSSHEIISILEKNMYKQIEKKSKFAIPSDLVRGI